ncbi:hypothetical protein SAY87_013716 [Trapa incisa]|uniref:Uncharacterized protein n=1 Tax=Trapa incisa TaxID=236973 RepID=A0AAN7K951_9MYRT|nr:hypothetical protein SAY87_013716 [Trapa incisa]
MDSFKIRMEEKLGLVHLSPQKSCIFKVHHELRKVNEKAYSPVLISIGPYHYERRKLDLQFMEQHKWRYLNDMIRRKESSEGTSRDDLLGRCFKILEEHEVRARGFFAVPFGKVEFIEMMLVDSCFILEYFRKCALREEKEVDPLFQADWIGNCLSRDLVLIENQIPFFVLTELLSVIGPWPNPNPLCLVYAAVNCLSVYRHLGTDQGTIASKFALQSISDLVPLGLLPRAISEEKGKLNVGSLQDIKHLLDLVRKFMFLEDILLLDGETIDNQVTRQPERGKDEDLMDPQKRIHTASKLREFGVKFKSVSKRKYYDIKFDNGILEIPILLVDDGTECYFRNLIAYEQHAYNNLSTSVRDYMCFMDGLIDSSKDVELLRRHGIIDGLLGDDEAIATMFNNITTHTLIKQDYYYKQVIHDLSEHCKKRRHVWMAILRMNYLHSPWEILSVLAAFLLLVLTFMQTIYTALSYYHA